MGCAASKLDNEDTVRRCKERHRLIKEAVYARHHLAAAHADYCRSLRVTGSALCSFAVGEPLTVSEQTPAVSLHPPASPSTAANSTHVPPFRSQSLRSDPPQPPPPLCPSPTLASSKLPHILSAPSHVAATTNRRRKPPKLPHILSESSFPQSPLSQNSNYAGNFEYPTAYQVNSTYSSTPSQSSSVWNWENFYPPSPPDSEFFNRKAQNQTHNHQYRQRHDDVDGEETETETERSEYGFFQPQRKQHNYYHNGNNIKNNHRSKQHSTVDEETEREEVQCSEWGDHDHNSTTSSSSNDGDEEEEEEDEESRSEIGTRSNFGSSIPAESVKQQPVFWNQSKSNKTEGARSSASFRTGESSDMKMVVRHKDLKEIVEVIKENFDKAAAAGDQVSEMLEIGRSQLDQSFSQLKKTLYHSTSVLANLSSRWTSKPPLVVKYRLDTGSLNEPGGLRSLCSTMERLLAWEKKFYQEVKAREGAKVECDKKLSKLQSQEYKGEDEVKLDKTKTSIKRLQSIIMVTSQAVSSTSTTIISLRDSDLVPQLVKLSHGFMYMWRSMHRYHEVQNNIVQQVCGLVNEPTKSDSTSELHMQATRDLEFAVSAWHSSFCRLIMFQRDFMHSIHGWFKLTLIPVSNDNMNGSMEPPDVFSFLDEWKLVLDRVPDMVASEAIKSFINVVHAISVKQTEELKIKKRTDCASTELEKKASSLRNIERKFYNSYSMVGIGHPDPGHDNGQVLDAQDPLAEKKSKLAACQRRVEDEMLRHAKAVELTRAMTLNNLQTGLPGVFQALTRFSALFTEALELVCSRSYAIK